MENYKKEVQHLVKRYAQIKRLKYPYVWGMLYGAIKTRLGIDVYDNHRRHPDGNRPSNRFAKPIEVITYYDELEKDVWKEVFDIAKFMFE